MRVLLFDETIEGHHTMWMEQIARALQPHLGENLFYAFPQPLETDASYIRCSEPPWHRVLRGVQSRFGGTIHVRACWAALDAVVRKHRIDRVLILHADPFLHDTYVPELSCAWVPIYFHPTFLRERSGECPEQALRSPGCRFIYVLDDHIREQLSLVAGKTVHKIPDFFEPSRSGPTERTRQLIREARGRPVFAAIGPITPHKGVGQFLRVAERRPDWHFLLVGKVRSRRHSAEDLRLLRKAGSTGNVTWFMDRLPHEELNQLTAMSDVHYAVYKDFLHSSNKLIRACENRRPLVVADGGYMAEIVHRYGIGRVCDPTAGVGAIETAMAAAMHGDWSSADWEGYEQQNALSRLPSALMPLLNG